MPSVKCKLSSVKCKVRSAEWCVECEVHSVKYRGWGADVWRKCMVQKCRVWSVKCKVWNVKCGVWNTESGVQRQPFVE